MARSLFLAAAIAVAGAGCTHGRGGHPQAAAPSPAASGRGMAARCPMAIPGTQLAAADTAAGEALTFTTTPDQVAALRERVHAMADMHNRHRAAGDPGHEHMPGMGGPATGPGTGELRPMELPPPAHAAVEDLPDGARLVVTPNDPADLARLQQTVRMHADHMREHGCGMMGGGHGS